MATEINCDAFYSDHRDIASCLDAIYQTERDGEFATHPLILQMLRTLENDVLKKLYIKSISVLVEIDGISPTETGVMDDYFYGDFQRQDFSYDFYTGYLDFSGRHYNAIFRSILNIFRQIANRDTIISPNLLNQLNADLVAVLEYVWQLREAIGEIGLHPCHAISSSSPYNNSNGVYMQAVGSDGTNGIVSGIHLRWSFTDELGSFHLPKGDYLQGSEVPLTGYNRRNDYVRIYRAVYRQENALSLNLDTCTPVVNFQNKSWIYTINATEDGKLHTDHIRLVFEDAAAYDSLSRQLDPESGFLAFINAYSGVLRLEVVGKALYQASLAISNPTAAPQALKVESVSGFSVGTIHNEEDDLRSYQTERFQSGENRSAVITAENIRYIRIKKDSQLELGNIWVKTYEGLLRLVPEDGWEQVGGGFALSLDDNVVFDRFENAEKPIDNLWPHFNGGTKVRAANYRDKWNQGTPQDPPIKELVDKYLTLSTTDPRAEEFLPVEFSASQDSEEGISVSNLDIVNLVSMDYHFARMFGLGHIDTALPDTSDRYIYQLRYANRKSRESAGTVNYTYTTLSTAITDSRLPEKPAMRPLTYAFPDQEGTINEMLDKDGYSKTEPLRVVNIGREKATEETGDFDFFHNLDAEVNSNFFITTKIVSYGIEYRKSTHPAYVKPEITYNADLGERLYYAYDDDNPEGVLEPVPVEDNQDSLYIHFVKENGIHHYAIYGIDWFSRSSEISEEEQTDETAVQPIDRISPPVNVGVQYIQEEDPRIFTTVKEQSWIRGRKQAFPGQDTGLTRVTFDWMDITDVTYADRSTAATLGNVPRADQVGALFLDRVPLELAGRISKVLHVPGDDSLARLTTAPHRLLDGTFVAPTLPIEDYPRFINGMLNTTEGIYRITDIASGPDGPDIIVEKRLFEDIVPDEAIAAFNGLRRRWVSPTAGERFTAVENLGEFTNWNPLSSTISLISFADAQQPEIETITDPEGNESHFWIGGISREAGIVPLFGDTLPEESQMPGFYRVTFDYALPEHTQANEPYRVDNPGNNAPGTLRTPHVEWYKGRVRMPLSNVPNSEKKELEVVRIASLDPLVLYVFDAGYADQPIYVPGDPAGRIKVNFHPGYRAYLFTEPEPGLFNKYNIEPVDGENDRRTILGLYANDTTRISSLSVISTPATLLAVRIDEPKPVEMPSISSNKVRPDATKLASFTFDIRITPNGGGQPRSPFGFLFYRTDHMEVLEALYEPATAAKIVADLSALTEDPFYDQRFSELVNVVFDAENPGHFRSYPATPHAYGFPLPDRDGMGLPTDSVQARQEQYRLAVQSTLMPLTEQPPIFSYLKQGFHTENAIPSIRDMDGKLLDPSDPLFDPFPMARKFQKANEEGTWYLRFTDYSLGGNSRQRYFYAATEINNKLQPGPLSPFAGPVEVLQTLPTEAPQVTGYDLVMDNNFGLAPTVVFHIAAVSGDDLISKVRLYRFHTQGDAVAISESESHVDTALEELGPEGYLIADTFSDKEGFPYYGKTIFYGLAGVRMITNEDDEEEEVLSLLSDVVPITIPDYMPPASPQLLYEPDESRLKWEPAGNDCIYRVFKQNNAGNWNRVYEILPPNTNGTMYYPFPEPLAYADEEGDRIYHRFKISVENTSGRYSLQEHEIVL